MEQSCPNTHHDLFTKQKPGSDPELDRRLKFLHRWDSRGSAKYEKGSCTCTEDDGMWFLIKWPCCIWRFPLSLLTHHELSCDFYRTLWARQATRADSNANTTWGLKSDFQVRPLGKKGHMHALEMLGLCQVFVDFIQWEEFYLKCLLMEKRALNGLYAGLWETCKLLSPAQQLNIWYAAFRKTRIQHFLCLFCVCTLDTGKGALALGPNRNPPQVSILRKGCSYSDINCNAAPPINTTVMDSRDTRRYEWFVDGKCDGTLKWEDFEINWN